MLRDYARQNRKVLTNAEFKLWCLIRNKELLGCKFRRQHVMGEYIVDFYCREVGLVIELDGEKHLTNKQYDDIRTAFLESKGYQVLRFWNQEVYENIEGVVESIADAIRGRIANKHIT